MNIHESFKITALPIDIANGDKEANLAIAEKAVRSLSPGTDMAVLPELFSTGFISDLDKARGIAEKSEGTTMQLIADLASKQHCAICGSFLATDGTNLYNRAFLMEPQGDVTFYDKHHLFVLSEESRMLAPGSKLPPVVRFRGMNIALAVCYDIRFPLWCRNTGARYDIMVIPANWPRKRAMAWECLLQARAIENQAFVVGANRSGEDEYGRYDNETFIFDYRGKRIDSAANTDIATNGTANPRSVSETAPDDTGNQPVTAVLSRNALYKYRDTFPFLADADEFVIVRKNRQVPENLDS